MANIRKRGNSYQIRVSCGYTSDQKQVSQSMTWTPEPGQTQRQIEKELKRQAVLFEESCMKGNVTAPVKFQEYTEQWFKDCAELNLKASTLQNYRWLSKRAYKALGFMRMDRISPRHIQRFIRELTEGERADGFEGNISPKTVKSHVSFVSTVFDYACKMQVVSVNPCRNVTLPKIIESEREIYGLQETQKLINLLLQEKPRNLKFVVFYILAIFSGFRRGELMGLEYRDFDFEYNTITVRRTSNTNPELGIYTDTVKSKNSNRAIKLPQDVINLVLRYKAEQEKFKAKVGSKWTETGRLFVKMERGEFGTPMHPNAPGLYFERFCKRTGMRYVSNHSWRHLYASSLIENGVDIKTVQHCMGHSSSRITLDLYCHVFQAYQAKSMAVISELWTVDSARLGMDGEEAV